MVYMNTPMVRLSVSLLNSLRIQMHLTAKHDHDFIPITLNFSINIGTPASTSQLAKDVTEFLSWVAQPEMATRKEMGIKVSISSGALSSLSIEPDCHIGNFYVSVLDVYVRRYSCCLLVEEAQMGSN